MASTKFINECKNGANSNRLGKVSVETIKKVSGTELELSNTLDKKISPRLYGYTKQNVYSGKNKNVNAEYVTAGDSSPASAFTNLSEYDGYKNVVEISSNIGYMTLRTNSMSSDFSPKIASGGIDITSMLLIKKTNVNTKIHFYLGSITGGAVYQDLKHYKDEANGWAWYYTTHTIPVSPSDTTINNHIRTAGADFATFYIAKIQTLIGSEPSDFEPYVGGKASPSPDYPQEIEVGKGKNLLNPVGTSRTISGLTFTDNGDGSFTLKGTSTEARSFGLTDLSRYPIYFKKGEYYTQSLIIISGKMEGSIVPAVINSEGIITYNYLSCSHGYLTSTRQAEEDLKVNGYTHYIASGKTVDVTYKVQLEKDKVATKWLPYNTIESKSRGKNLLENSSFTKSFDKWSAMSDAEITEKLGQKCLHIKSSLLITRTTMQDISKKVEPGKIYTVSCYAYVENFTAGTTNPYFSIYFDGRKLDGSWVGAYRVNGNASFSNYDYSNGFAKLTYTLQIPADVDLTKSYGIYIYTRDVEADLYLYDLQMEPGDIDTDYQEYQESSIQYNLGDNFLADKDYIENGVLNKNIRHLRLAVADMNNNDTYPGWRNVPYIGTDYPEQNAQLHTFSTYITNIGKWGFGLNSTNGGSTLFISKTIFNGLTQTQIKEQYPDLVIDLYYEMPETEQIPLETTGELRTFEPNTIITNDLDSEMEVEYSSWDTEITNSDNLTDISVEDSCYVDGQIIGTTFEKKTTSQLIAVPNDVDLIDKKIKVEIGVKYDDLSNEMIKMGNYTIERPKDEQTENFTQITAYDDFNSLDNPYVCNLDFSKDVTIADFYIDVCNQLELTPMKTAFLNSDIKVTANPFVNKETLRVVLQEIEKVSCTFSEIDYETNKIDLVWLSENEEPDYEFATNDYTTLEGGKITYGPVNCLVIKESQIEGENTVRQDDESIKTNGETQIAIQDSYFLFTQALREQAIDNIWNRVKGLTYVDCKLITSYGKPFLKVGKKIRVNVNDGRVFDTYVLKHTFKYDGAFESTIESPALTKQETKVKSKSISESIRLTEIKVDKALGTITSTVKTVKELEESIQYFSVDLSQYSLTIPTDNARKPVETKNYDINFYGYYKGKQIVPEVLIDGSNTGITASKTDSYIRFAVDNNIAITNSLNEYEITFKYTADDGIYTLVKKVTISMAQKGDTGATGPQGQQGIQGPAGANGTSTYFHVRYSANSTGNPMTTAPTSTTKYMGVASTTSATAPTSYSAYTWSLIKGADGTDGEPGATGANGLTSYLHIKYSEDGRTFTPADEEYAEGEKPSAYIGQYVDYTEADSVTFSDYKWYKFTENIDETLNQMKGDINANNTSINNNYQELIGKFKDYTPTSQTIQLEQSVTQLQTDTYTKTEINTKLTDGSVTKVMTASGTFDENGMHYEKTGAPTKSTINESGVNVDSSTTGEELLFAGYDKELEQTIVRTENLTVRNYLVIGKNSRIEDYEDENGNAGGGIFIL